MRVAVTGASGFVGRHVIQALRMRDVEVVAVSRSAPVDQAELPAVEVVSLDIADCGTDSFRRMGQPDVLIHLAWDGLPNYKSSTHLDMQLPMQLRFLQSCVASGLQHLVVSGTCLEYGMQSGALREDMATSPSTTYGMAKDLLRRQLQDALSVNSGELTWLRLFYLYGSGQGASSLHAQLRAAVARGDPVFDLSPGDQIRDFLAVEEAARIIAELALHPCPTDVVNVCSGQPVSIHDMVRTWLDAWHATIELRFGIHPYPDYEPLSFWGSRTILDGVLGTT